MRYLIGMDIGGTHTDGVLVDTQKQIVAKAKCCTTEDLLSGFKKVLQQLKKNVNPKQVSAIFLGTTHGTNALLQRKGLQRVGLLRLAGGKPLLLPPAISWPRDMRDALGITYETLGGGFECDGRLLSPFCKKEVRLSVKRLLEKGAESLAVVGIFSPLCTTSELEIAECIQHTFGTQIPISLSHEIGGLGFMERENATLMNAALRQTMAKGFAQMEEACMQEGFDATLSITQNDGSLISVAEGIKYPVLTLAAGPTNSLIGGCRLAGYENAIVIDVGGTSTDIGMLQNNFPVRSMKPSNVGGVSVHFPAPDLLSTALGGGSCICPTTFQIGPLSVGRGLHQQALCFGGSTLTFTDIAIKLGHLSISEASKCHLKMHPNMPSTKQCEAIYAQAEEKITFLIQQMRGRHTDLPTLFVGGGSRLFCSKFSLKNADQALDVFQEHFDVANAYGAALAEVAGTVDTVISLTQREHTLNLLHEKARNQAILKGADPLCVRLVDQQIIPYPYASNNMTRVIVRWSGKKRIHSI